MISRRRFGLMAAGGLGFGFSCRNDPAGPSVGVLPPLDQARGVPNATAFENLKLLTALAQRERPGCYLYELQGTVDVVVGRSVNIFQFFFRFERTDLTSAGTDYWRVEPDGKIAFTGGLTTGRDAWLEDIGHRLLLDSQRMVQIARTNGLEACAQKPGATAGVRYRFISGIPICEVGIAQTAGLTVHAETGEVLARENRC